ncbi:Glycosyltransferase involved in cell wall bisynthesis [Aquiflexum balticum DSM 16537]|uniref:Glycosyltransferase involved in cell wall bisynthesis n=1 Tax=Aquiflexum balticum DSM 16537 TaxID=758820 RepID=A0A1W2HBR3_9BACT|nr:glycosyltransferase family 4 protein [Aquiflexum balticum]SMD46309.1 Glycosyltransferase involved in cell wall bisynthesis [Aquiflexum balticum DSM 16537]
MPKILFSQFANIELIVEGGNPRGGAAVQTLVWMHAFNKLGFDIQQVIYETETRPKKKEFDWVETITVYNPNVKRIRSWYTYKLPAYFKTLKTAKCDYVYSSIPKWYFFYINIFCKILGIKHIIRIPSDEMVDKRIFLTESKIDNFYIQKSFATADLILAQNEYQFVNLKRKFPKQQIVKIYNPTIINEEFLKIKTELQGHIAWIANFRHRKNMALLLKIAELLPKENFMIAGVPLLPLDEETEDSVENLRKLKNVTFLGNVGREDILGFLSKAKFLLSTARYEGFSNTFLEAMCTGTPVLTTHTANPDELINRYELGYVYENENEICSIIENLTMEKYLTWSKNCIAYVKENHDYKYLGNKLMNQIKCL